MACVLAQDDRQAADPQGCDRQEEQAQALALERRL
jgi:hypothetical protein